jgi:hypothetical protein
LQSDIRQEFSSRVFYESEGELYLLVFRGGEEEDEERIRIYIELLIFYLVCELI